MEAAKGKDDPVVPKWVFLFLFLGFSSLVGVVIVKLFEHGLRFF